MRLQLRRLAGDRVHLDLPLSRVRTLDIRALCGVLPAKVSPNGRSLELETRLRLHDGNTTEWITLRQRWRCVRDRNGEFIGIQPMNPKPLAARRGLAVRLHALRVAASGRQVDVLVTVLNQRRARPSRVVSSLWNLRILVTAGGRQRMVRLKELRARRSRTVRLTLTVPAVVGAQPCVRVAASADSARPAAARRCATVAGTAPVAGLGSVRTLAGAGQRSPSMALLLDDLSRTIDG